MSFTTPVARALVANIDMYQHINHATMGDPSRRGPIPFLREPFGATIETIGLLIADVRISYKGQLRPRDPPLQVTIVDQAGAGRRLHRSGTKCVR